MVGAFDAWAVCIPPCKQNMTGNLHVQCATACSSINYVWELWSSGACQAAIAAFGADMLSLHGNLLHAEMSLYTDVLVLLSS